MATLDITSIAERPDLFIAVDCYDCGEVAARWVHDVCSETWCDRCESAYEAIYAEQGGQ